MAIKIILPAKITLPRKTKADKVYHINLNNYRNWHYIISNQIKQAYADAISPQLIGIKFRTKIGLEFTLFRKDKRKVDRANILSIHEKFFCDALQKMDCLPDDSDEWIDSTLYLTSPEKSLDNYVEVKIIEKRG